MKMNMDDILGIGFQICVLFSLLVLCLFAADVVYHHYQQEHIQVSGV